MVLFMKGAFIKIFALVFFIIGLLTFPLFAQEQVEMVGQEDNQEDESVVELTADQVNYDKENDQMVFIGNVVILQEDTTLTAG